jgi:hypothetical protein
MVTPSNHPEKPENQAIENPQISVDKKQMRFIITARH